MILIAIIDNGSLFLFVKDIIERDKTEKLSNARIIPIPFKIKAQKVLIDLLQVV